MRAVASERSSLDRLASVSVYSSLTGASVPVDQIATLERTTGYPFIQREDLIRTVTVEARNPTLSPEDMVPLLQPKIDAMNQDLAPGHFVEFDGVIDDTGESNAALGATVPLVLGLIFLFLTVQFNGFRRPVILLLCLPFVVIGAAVGLTVMQASFGFMVILSLFALVGIIINNSIVLLDRIDIEISEGENEGIDAVISACKRRLRPILMATITTIIGLLPLIITKDVLFYGMASSIAFGLGIGTFVISLGLTPVLYCLFFGIRYAPKTRKGPRKTGLLTSGEPA